MDYNTRTDPMTHFSSEPLIAWKESHILHGKCKCGLKRKEHALKCQLGYYGYELRCKCGKAIFMHNNNYY